jgi:hypothetical protein
LEIGKSALLAGLQETMNRSDAANVKVLAGFIVVNNRHNSAINPIGNVSEGTVPASKGTPSVLQRRRK